MSTLTVVIILETITLNRNLKDKNRIRSPPMFCLTFPEFLQIFINFLFKEPYSLHKIGFEVFSCALALLEYSGLDVVGWVDFGGEILSWFLLILFLS